MKIRGKFTVQSHKRNAYSLAYTELALGAVYDQTIPEDQRYIEATPTGQITMLVMDRVAEHFPLGKQFYVDFTPVEEAAQ